VEAFPSRIHNDWGYVLATATAPFNVTADLTVAADDAAITASWRRRTFRTGAGVRRPIGNIAALAVPLHTEAPRGPSRLATGVGLLV